MIYFILLILLPAAAWFAGWLSQITQLNFWLIFIPIILALAFFYQYGSKIFSKK